MASEVWAHKPPCQRAQRARPLVFGFGPRWSGALGRVKSRGVFYGLSYGFLWVFITMGFHNYGFSSVFNDLFKMQSIPLNMGSNTWGRKV